MSLALSGVAAGQDTNDDVLAQVQLAAAKEKSLNAQVMLMELGGFIQTGYLYNNGGGNSQTNGFSVESERHHPRREGLLPRFWSVDRQQSVLRSSRCTS